MSSRHRSVVRSPTWPRRSATTCAVALSTGVLVRKVDFLEQLMPSVNVLAKFAYQRPDQFFPRLKGDLAAAMAQHADNPIVQELGSGGYERVVALLEEWRPDAVVSVVSVAAAVASEAASALGFVSCAVITDFSLARCVAPPRDGRVLRRVTRRQRCARRRGSRVGSRHRLRYACFRRR